MDKVTVLNRVYSANLPSRAKTIMFYLVNRSNKELTCFPAIPRIAKETGMSERTVQRALKELCEEGYLEKIQRYRENGGQSSNLYLLLMKEETKPDDFSNNLVDDADNTEDYSAEMDSESLCENVCKGEDNINDTISCCQRMQFVDFSFFDKVSLFPDCHRPGDNCVPPLNYTG